MNKDQVKHLVVHCAYTPSNMDIGADDIDRWHKEKGWSGCGYHQVIRRNGDVEDGRPMNKAGAHVRGNHLPQMMYTLYLKRFSSNNKVRKSKVLTA